MSTLTSGFSLLNAATTCSWYAFAGASAAPQFQTVSVPDFVSPVFPPDGVVLAPPHPVSTSAAAARTAADPINRFIANASRSSLSVAGEAPRLWCARRAGQRLAGTRNLVLHTYDVKRPRVDFLLGKSPPAQRGSPVLLLPGARP